MQRVATYWHMLPEAAQARKAIWAAVNPHTGKRRIDEAFPPALRSQTLENEMFIRFKNGSTWQVLGSDNYNSLVGSPPAGVVLSEFALNDPAAWAYLKPVLDENDGWALFITTPRGDNHAKSMFDMALSSDHWFAELQTALDSGRFSQSELDEILAEYIGTWGPDLGKGLFEQEYLCSWTAALFGTYYADVINQLRAQGRIGDVPYDPSLPVNTFWDLGRNDTTAIWFHQFTGSSHHLIDYYEARGHRLDHYAKHLKSLPYNYGRHYLPHDGENDFLVGDSAQEQLGTLEIKPIEIVERITNIHDGIRMTRSLLPLCRFDAVKCAPGIRALEHYRAKYNDKLKTQSFFPVHDWASNGADAFRQIAQGFSASSGFSSFGNKKISDRDETGFHRYSRTARTQRQQRRHIV